ncbi:MAG: FAD-dependent oxidoreductase [Pseudomonadales bacterium]|nr:FAD-dependent oxidoreductase [Pseudomonadales bacterium]NIX08313.1 FAD-dependent oxidoreductase [Pseudomonadales bacterium]
MTQPKETDWELTVDLVVVGSGAAGMACALTARLEGLDVLMIEKTDHYGGTTALSGGVLWVPNNSLMEQAGIEDSADRAVTYLKHNIGNRVSAARLETFVEHAPRMLDFLRAHRCLEVDVFEGFPDYRPEDPGACQGGRSVEPKVFAGRKLGSALTALRARAAMAPGGIVGTMTELRRLAAVRSNPLELLKAWKVFPRNLWNRLSGAQHLANGRALIAWLRHAMERNGVPLWLNAPLARLVLDDDGVSGVVVMRGEAPVRVAARRGVVITAGGFEHNGDMRSEYFGENTAEYSSGSPGNTGDAIRAGLDAGASADLMDDAWWAPTFMPPGQGPQIVIFERGKPGNIIVDAAGQRFANEADPYNELVKQMQEADRSGASAIPAYLIFDNRYRSKYPLGGMLPGVTPRRYLDNGFVVRADTLAELSESMGIDPAGLENTVARFNAMAASGSDEDYHRGESAFDRFAGDPAVRPNPCLAPLEEPPFYGMRLYPGDLGTKGGLLTNEHAQVLRGDGTVIRGLYAAGNSSASAMGNFYPGAGGTIGPAMTFGYIAARHAAAA